MKRRRRTASGVHNMSRLPAAPSRFPADACFPVCRWSWLKTMRKNCLAAAADSMRPPAPGTAPPPNSAASFFRLPRSSSSAASPLRSSSSGTFWSAIRTSASPVFKTFRPLASNEVSRQDILPAFGADIGRNIFFIHLNDRRKQLEQIPWIEHATVMRLLPNQIRVVIKERTPIAFVRLGSDIELADANGVVLSMSPEAMTTHHYSFPVVTGIDPRDPLPSRRARMAVYQRLIGELDSTGRHFSNQISEIDLTDPEDARVLMPEQGADILAHFGDDRFLERYQRYQAHICGMAPAVSASFRRRSALRQPGGVGDGAVVRRRASRGERHRRQARGQCCLRCSGLERGNCQAIAGGCPRLQPRHIRTPRLRPLNAKPTPAAPRKTGQGSRRNWQRPGTRPGCAA